MISGDTYGILNRLLLNQQIEPSPEGILRILGFVHVYTASGLHLIALESFLQKFFGRSLRTRKILTLFFWFFLFLIWKLQDFRLGFARILILFFLRALARTQGFRWRVYFPLFIAFCFDFALGIDSGWQHYYLAILGGMLGLELAKNRNTFVQHLYLSIASWLMTAPLDIMHQHTISWMTPIWSMITIPVISLFLYPVSVISYLLLDRVPMIIMNIWNFGVEVLLKIVDLGYTFSVIHQRTMVISIIVAFCVAIIMSKINRKNSLFLAIFGVFPLFLLRETTLPVKLVQLNVGQGDSLLIQKNERIEMIDLGTSRDVKMEKIILHLAKYGVTHLDALLFSHLDEDHAGGVKLLLPWVPTKQIEVNSKFARTSKMRNWLLDFPATEWCESGCFRSGSIDWIDGRSTKARSRSHANLSGNDLMATAIIPLSKIEVYLALGDSNSRQEDLFWDLHNEEIFRYPHRILKVSHHGSRYSSNLEFLKKVNPVQAVISVGRRNHYHHPHYSVIEELFSEKIPIHRTDRNGDYVWN